MLFAAVMMAATAAINAGIGVFYKGAAGSLGRVWGKSILAEYDLFLKERYGIFGFYGNDHSSAEKLKFYADYSFSGKKYIKTCDISAETGKYSLSAAENLKEQIRDAVLYGTEPEAYGTSSENPRRKENRYIESLWIKKSLPSYGKTKNLYIAELAEKIKGGLNADSAAGQLAADRYILKFFKNYADGKDLGKTYFDCETEYIISGKLNDGEAVKNVKSKIKTMRNILNLYYLYSCSEKRQAVLSMAELITPGPAALATQAVMMEIWAYMEAENDMDILYSGETVPLLKKDRNWALSAENVFKTAGSGENLKLPDIDMSEGGDGNAGKKEQGNSGEKERGSSGGKGGGFIRPQTLEGENYEDYLGVLLLGLTEETKLLRIADLIQINGKYLYCDSFLIKDYCSGIEYKIKVNGYEKNFKERY